MRRLAAIALAFALCPAENLQASGDGPRVHSPTPVGVNVLLLNGASLQDANRTFDPSLIKPFSRFDTNIVNLAYIRTQKVKNRHVMMMGILRGGQARRQTLIPGGKEISSSNGLADPYVGVSVNLSGLPPLDRESFREFVPGPTVSFLFGAFLPLGEYDSENIINLGANRWTLRFALPITKPFSGFRGLPGSLELIPNVMFFTENRDRNLNQDPLFYLEGHVAQSFAPRTWGSLGFLYDRGGKTTIKGETTNGSQQSLALTATLGFNFSPRWGLQLRYGQVVAQNEFGLVGKVYQFKLARIF